MKPMRTASAIKAFMRYVEFRHPNAIEQIDQTNAIPGKRHDQILIRHLTMEEVRAVLDAPDPMTRLGIRDRAMLHLCFADGLRVSQLIGLTLENVTLQSSPSILVFGKGRRERNLPLWRKTVRALRACLAVRGKPPATELFVNAQGDGDNLRRIRIHTGKADSRRRRPMPVVAWPHANPVSAVT